MANVSVVGLETALAAVTASSGKGTKGDKFSEAFSNKNTTVSTFSTFFLSKMEEIAAHQSHKPE